MKRSGLLLVTMIVSATLLPGCAQLVLATAFVLMAGWILYLGQAIILAAIEPTRPIAIVLSSDREV